MRRSLLASFAAILWACLPVAAFAGDPAPAAAPAAAEKPLVLANTVCPVSGEPAEADVTTVWSGIEVRFCCPGCIGPFKADPAKYAPVLLRDLATRLAAARATAPAGAVGPAAATATDASGKGTCGGGCGAKKEGGGCPGACPGKGEGGCGGACAEKGEGGCGGACAGKGEGGCEGTCPATGKTGPAPHGPMGTDAPATPEAAKPAAAPALEVVDLENATCPVMEGRPVRASVVGTWRNVKVRYCCAGCDGRFQKDPEAYLAKMAAADAAVARRIESARAAWAAAHPAK